MRYYLAGGKTITLTDQDFVAEGGEGKIYRQGQTAYKIYTDPNKMIPSAKFQELQVLTHSNIICPQQLLFDKQQNPVGFSMAQVLNAVGLPRLFTSDFCQQHRITPDLQLKLLGNIRDTIQFIHDQNCLMVDGNEMNYLVSEHDWITPYFIDVDSYQTPHFPATAQMLSIKDYHSTQLSTLTDWFAFAIVACQVLVGIHPYKGKHPDFKKHDLAARMQANMSIFNSAVTVPAATRDFAVIPPAWLDWFIQVLEKGQRLAPPSVTGSAVQVPVAAPAAISSVHLQISLLAQFAAPIRQYLAYNGAQLVLAGEQAYVGKTAFKLPNADSVLALEPRSGRALAFSVENQQLQVFDIEKQSPLTVNLAAQRVLQHENDVFFVHEDRLMAVKTVLLNQQLHVTAGTQWQIMPHAHQVLDGLIYQNVLGQPWLVIPWKANACMIRAIPELHGYQVVSGRHQRGVVMLCGHKNGQYDQLIFRFNADYSHYDCQRLENCDLLTNNFVTLDNDMVAHIAQDGELNLLHRHADARKQLQDPQLNTTMQLTHDGMRVLFYTNNTLYQMTMK